MWNAFCITWGILLAITTFGYSAFGVKKLIEFEEEFREKMNK